MTMPDDVAEQTRNIYATFAKVMKEAGGELADIVRLRTFVTDVSYCEAVVKVQGEVFGAIRPAATIVVVSALLKPEMKVEIEADARLSRSSAIALPVRPAPSSTHKAHQPVGAISPSTSLQPLGAMKKLQPSHCLPSFGVA